MRPFLQVFVQPLQLRRVGRVQGFDMSATNQWHWRPDYEVIELAQCRCVNWGPSCAGGLAQQQLQNILCIFETCEVTRPAATTPPACRDEWTALGPVIEAMGFDFYDAESNMAPAAVDLTARITAPGTWNAVAFWFELQLDEETRLDSGPYCDKVQDGDCMQMGEQLMLWTDRLHGQMETQFVSRCNRGVVAIVIKPRGCMLTCMHTMLYVIVLAPPAKTGRYMAASGPVDGGAGGGARHAAAADSKPRHVWHLLQPWRRECSSRSWG